MTRPLVSVVITTYNTGRYLPETLESVFAQSYPAAEVIVVDDGSSDDSVARAREFGDRIRLIARPHAGLGPARDAGIAASTGDFLAFLDSDDLWAPEALAVQLDVAARHPASGLIVADGVGFGTPDESNDSLLDPAMSALVAEADHHESTGQFHREFVTRNWIVCPAQTLVAALGPTTRWDRCAPNPTAPRTTTTTCASRAFFPMTFHGAVLARWRFRADSMSGGPDERHFRWACQALGVLARERDDGPSESRHDVVAAIRATLRRGSGLARRAVSDGRRPDPDDLDILYRAAPWNPYVLATRALLALPPTLGREVSRGVEKSFTRGAATRG